MNIRVRKIIYQVFMDQLNEDGDVIGEISTQEPLIIWAHQLDSLPSLVAQVVEQAKTQTID